MLCSLAEMVEISPSKVLELVPEATTAQITAFLAMGEAAINAQEGSGRLESSEASKRRVLPDDRDTISLLAQLKQLPVSDPVGSAKLASPTEEKSEFMEALRKLVPPKDGGSKLKSLQFSETFQNKILGLLDAASPKGQFDSDHFEKVYKKLKNDPLARSRLENLHAARAHKYGHAHFGEKTWYKESTNLASRFKTQIDRRKFRAGLKGLVDFLNQLNIMDLEKSLHSGESEGFNFLKMPGQIHPEAFCKYLKNVPPIKLIEFINKQKATEIQTLLSKVSELAHFSQSMADFYAFDDALEPALAVICEVLRGNEDVGAILKKRATTFLNLAEPYHKHRSETDHDVVGNIRSKKSVGLQPTKKRPRNHCFKFQEGVCRYKKCFFEHVCSECGSRKHGSYKCPEKNARKSKSREQRSRR